MSFLESGSLVYKTVLPTGDARASDLVYCERPRPHTNVPPLAINPMGQLLTNWVAPGNQPDSSSDRIGSD